MKKILLSAVILFFATASFSQSEKLKALYPEKVILHSVEGARHNNLPDFPEFFDILYDVLYVDPVTEKAS